MESIKVVAYFTKKECKSYMICTLLLYSNAKNNGKI